MRIEGFKIGFQEEDVRKSGDLEVVYLDSSKNYPVPNIADKRSFELSWKRNATDLKLLIGNSRLNNPSMSGGLLQHMGEIDRLVILGNGESEQNIKKGVPGFKFLGLGKTISDGSPLDYYLFNHPFETAISWIPSTRSNWPVGIFGYGACPKFINRYHGLHFFYSSGWESRGSNLKLIDLIDPISSAFHLANILSCKEIVFGRCGLQYKREKPGMVKVGSSFMYPQQILSLSLLSALVFWTIRGGRRVYSLDIDEEWVPRPEDWNQELVCA